MALTISQLEVFKAGDEVWAINKTSGDQRGPIVIGIKTAQGDEQLYVPCTFAPICLTEQASLQTMLRSSSFRQAYRSLLFMLIDGKEASTMLSDPEIAAEYKRVKAETAMGLKTDITTGMGLEASVTGGDTVIDTKTGQSVSGISTPVASLLAGMEDMKDADLLVAIRKMGDLSRAEYSAIRTEARKLGYVKTAEYLSTKLPAKKTK